MGTSLAALVVLTGVAAAEPESKLGRFEFQRIQMGVPIQITVYSAGEVAANTAVRAAFDRIKQLNDILSDYDPDSELSRLCRDAKTGQPVPVSPELALVLRKSFEVSTATDGAFDCTIGPVVKLWRKARRLRQLPSNDELQAALRKTDYRNVRVEDKSNTVELLESGLQIDLGGIAKGYAADEAIRVLKQHGVKIALVAAAGDIVAGDPPPGRAGWKVGVGPLENAEAPPKYFLNLANQAVSTSGDAFQFVEIDGRRYSHIVDPKTGLGITRRSSVTVLAPNGITSDSFASAFCVVGPEKSLRVAKTQKGLEVLIVEQASDGTPRETRTDGMKLDRAAE